MADGQLRRWVHIAGGSLATACRSGPGHSVPAGGQRRLAVAADEWTRRGCAYEAAIAQLGGDVAAVEARSPPSVSWVREPRRAVLSNVWQRCAAPRAGVVLPTSWRTLMD